MIKFYKKFKLISFSFYVNILGIEIKNGMKKTIINKLLLVIVSKGGIHEK